MRNETQIGGFCLFVFFYILFVASKEQTRRDGVVVSREIEREIHKERKKQQISHKQHRQQHRLEVFLFFFVFSTHQHIKGKK
jgi:hypothetical protein